jgi:peptidoglycan/LPS O-acetylase OafA/YrhL
MKRILKAVGWFFFAIDAAAMLFFLSWSLTASTRDGELAYAIFFLLFTLAFVSVGGGALLISAKRGSILGLWCSTLFLGIPPIIVASLRISNSL